MTYNAQHDGVFNAGSDEAENRYDHYEHTNSHQQNRSGREQAGLVRLVRRDKVDQLQDAGIDVEPNSNCQHAQSGQLNTHNKTVVTVYVKNKTFAKMF